MYHSIVEHCRTECALHGSEETSEVSVPVTEKKNVQRLVLLGGGHSHLSVLKNLGMRPVEGLQTTLVTKDIMTPYRCE
jgi:hypothetical protein